MDDKLFQNTEIAFANKTNKDLRKAYLLFKSMSSSGFVKFGGVLLNVANKINFPVSWALKPTIYGHFVGGTSIENCKEAIGNLKKYNVKGVLDYSVEGGHSDDIIEKTLNETIKTIHNAAENRDDIPFTVFKPTAFANPSFFENVDKDKPLTDELEVEYKKFNKRVEILCSEAHKRQVPIMIDAEDSWYQHLVDATIDTMMEKYNKDKAIVYNTLQMYRHDRLDYLKESIEKARAKGYYYGVKFVRGAYMEKERERALQHNYPSPINPDKASTDNLFDAAIAYSVDNIDIVEIFCGTHNEKSNMLLAQKIKEKGLENNDKRIYFAQLYGMSDHISFNLAHLGYNVCKYLPYGPVKAVTPYLIRRAEENTSIAGQTSRELALINLELNRRKNK